MRERSAAALEEIGGRCVSEAHPVIVAGASGYTGALAAELVWRHPRLELVAATSRSEAGRRLDQPVSPLPGARSS